MLLYVNKTLHLVNIFALLFTLCACSDGLPLNNELDELELEEADLVFRTGRSLASRVVLASDAQGYYSHIGIIVKQNDSFFVTHAVPGETQPYELDTVKVELLSNFFNSEKAKAGCIMRLDINNVQKHQIAQYALQKANCGTQFDHQYNLVDTTKLYCTELVWIAYQSAGIDLTNNNRQYINFSKFKGDMIFPSHIQTNKKLKSIYSFNNH